MPLFVVVLISLFLVADVTWTVTIARKLRRATFGKAARRVFIGFIALQLVGLLWALLGRLFDLGSPPALLTAEVLMWHLLTLPVLLVASILFGILWLVAKLVRSAKVPSIKEAPPTSVETEVAPSRRGFLIGAVAAAPPLLTIATAGYSRTQWENFRLRKIDVPLRSLPRELDGLTIAQVSDVHIGDFTTPRLLTKIVDAALKLDADFVVMTGDLINRRLSDLDEGLDLARRLNAAGNVHLIEGNHDLFEGRAIFDKRVRAAGLPLLVNETTIVRPRHRAMDVQLLGLEWGTPELGGERAAKAAMPGLLAQVRRETFPILLAHHPHAFDYANASIPLTLAGHTHGGQLGLTPDLTIGHLMYRYSSGLYEKAGRAIVVSNGVGNWFPLRVNVPAEIVQITLRAIA